MDTAANSFRDARLEKGLSLEAIASPLGLNRSTVMRWEVGRVPAERVVDVERVTGIPRHTLRPDLYPVQDGASASRTTPEAAE